LILSHFVNLSSCLLLCIYMVQQYQLTHFPSRRHVIVLVWAIQHIDCVLFLHGGIGTFPGGLTNYCPSVLDTVEWVIWPVKIVPNMTYNVFDGTLNPTLLLLLLLLLLLHETTLYVRECHLYKENKLWNSNVISREKNCGKPVVIVLCLAYLLWFVCHCSTVFDLCACHCTVNHCCSYSEVFIRPSIPQQYLYISDIYLRVKVVKCCCCCCCLYDASGGETTAEKLRGTKVWVPTPTEAVLGVSAGGGRPLPLWGSGVMTPENFWKLRC